MQQTAEVIDFSAARQRKELQSEPWVKKERIAEYFDVSPRTIYRWVDKGCPKKHLRGGALRFQLPAVIAWVESRSK